MTPGPEPPSPIAELVSAAALGEGLTPAQVDRLRLELIDRAKANGATYAQLARMLGFPSGQQAKKAIHGLRERVKRAGVAAQFTQNRDG